MSWDTWGKSRVFVLTCELSVTNIFYQAPNYSRALRTLMGSVDNIVVQIFCVNP